MTKILFTHSYFYQFDAKQWATKQPYPPLGTLYAASLMRSKGYQVALHDTNLVSNAGTILPALKKEQPKYLVIYDDGFNYLTKMCLTNMRKAAFQMAKYAKEHGCTIIACSSDSTDHYQSYLMEGVDYVIHGEGEETLVELIETLESNGAVTDILGISYKKVKDIHKNLKRSVLRNLDSLPRPAWDLIDIEPYKAIWSKSTKPFTLNIATTRGCPYKCNWCAKPIYGNRYNAHSPQRIVNEIEDLQQRFGVNYFWMCDDIFGLKPGWVQEFKNLVVDKNLKFKYKIQSRADLLLKEDNIEALATSGLDTVWIGAESGSQKILDAMDKGTTVEQIKKATLLLKSKGVKVAFFLQFGYLGEDKIDIDKTIQMVLDLMPDEIGISVSYPLPGTKFYDKVKADLVNKANWTDSNDLDMMFENTYSNAFYKTLHQYVHNRYRIKRGLQSMTGQRHNTIKNIGSMLFATPKAIQQHFWLEKEALR